ncbi:MAG: DedA family protein [Thermoleophilia bacterium]
MPELFVAISFLSRLSADVQHLFTLYGYPIVFFAVLSESAGVPVPGETVLLAAAVAAQRGSLNLPLIWLLAASAAIIGDNFGFWLGHWGGRPLLMRYGRILHVREKHLRMLDLYYAKHGAKTVFFGRWVLFLRVWAALFAGAAHMRWRRFFLFNALGGTAWAVSMSTLAYVFSASVGRIQATFGVIGWVTAILVALGIIAFVIREQRRSLRRLAALADDADAESATELASDRDEAAPATSDGTSPVAGEVAGETASDPLDL